MRKKRAVTSWSYTTTVYDTEYGQVKASRIGDGQPTFEGVPCVLTLKDFEKYVAGLTEILNTEKMGGV